MKKLQAVFVLALGMALAAAPVRAEGGPREEGTATLGGPRLVTVLAMGRKITLRAYTTSIPDELMVAASDPALASLAAAFGATVSWHEETFRCSAGGKTAQLRLGQARYPDTPEGRQLPLPAQEIEGTPHIPLSVLEDMLDSRLTQAAGGTLYLEPLIREVRFEGDERRPRLVVRASAPVRYKTFVLKNPARYVVDLYGAVLDTPTNRVDHPGLGTVRLGQFKLGPAVSRVVIPLQPSVKITPPAFRRGQELAFAVDVTAVDTPVRDLPQVRLLEARLEPMVAGQRMVLKFSGPVQYEWTRLLPPDNRFFVDFPRAVLVGPRQELSPSADPFLSGVVVSQFQKDPEPVVRMSLRLGRPAEIRVVPGDEPGILAVEVHHQEIDPSVALLKGYGATQYPQTGGVICLDPGHGGTDPGAVNRALGIYEKDVTLDICLRLGAILRKEGWNVVMTRADDRDVSWPGSTAAQELGARVKIANDLGADVFLSVHCNASASPSGNGTSLHVYKRGDYLLARELKQAVLNGTGRADRGTQRNRFYVLAHSRMPAVLIETAFITNPGEGALLASPEYRQRVAESIAAGLRQYAARYLNRVTAER
jgi:N-acetylmuramoyl-L-alanine amidase